MIQSDLDTSNPSPFMIQGELDTKKPSPLMLQGDSDTRKLSPLMIQGGIKGGLENPIGYDAVLQYPLQRDTLNLSNKNYVTCGSIRSATKKGN